MTWTYTNPSTSNRDAVRYLTGETDTNNQTTSDEEIAFQLAQEGGIYAAAAGVADALQAKYARLADAAFGPSAVKYSQRSEAYRKLAADLRRKVGMRAVPFAGGISIADKDSREQDTDRVQPTFSKEMFDHPGGTDLAVTDTESNFP